MTDDNKLHLKRDLPTSTVTIICKYGHVSLVQFLHIHVKAVERIWLDSDWCNKYIIELESYTCYQKSFVQNLNHR